MESLQWTFLLAVALMGVASAGAVMLLVSPRSSRPFAIVFGVAWFFACFIPLAVLWLAPASSPFAVNGGLDYGGALPFPIAIGIAGIVLALVAHQRTDVSSDPERDVPDSPLLATRWRTAAASIGAATAGCAAWLIVAEGEINAYAVSAAVSTIAMAGVAVAVTGVLWGVRRALPQPYAALCAVVACLATAAGSAAYIGLTASIGLGIVSAVIGHQTARSVARRTASGELGLCAAAVVGGVVGLVALGLLDASSGFFYSGQPTLLLAQLQMVGVRAGFAAGVVAIVAVALRLITRGRYRA